MMSAHLFGRTWRSRDRFPVQQRPPQNSDSGHWGLFIVESAARGEGACCDWIFLRIYVRGCGRVGLDHSAFDRLSVLPWPCSPMLPCLSSRPYTVTWTGNFAKSFVEIDLYYCGPDCREVHIPQYCPEQVAVFRHTHLPAPSTRDHLRMKYLVPAHTTKTKGISAQVSIIFSGV